MAGVFDQLDLSPGPFELARRAAEAGPGYLDLTSSNPTRHGLRFPPEILAAAAAGYWAERVYAPDAHGNPRARAAIQAYYAARQPPLALELDDLFITASTSEAYNLLFHLLCDPGDNLLAPEVSYPLFEYFAELRGIELRPYALDEGRNWQIDQASLRAATDERTRGVLIVSPHNPTGAIIAQAQPGLRALGLPLIIDEVFAPFAFGDAKTPPLAALHPELPCFTLNGISKMFALPDLKLGWIALNPAARHYAGRLELLNDTFLGANALTQSMLPQLFAAGQDFIAKMVEQVGENIRQAAVIWAGHPQIRFTPPQGGYYLFPAISGWEDEEALALFLLEQGILVHPGYFYGAPEGCHLMLSALTEPAIFRAGIARLAELLRVSA